MSSGCFYRGNDALLFLDRVKARHLVGVFNRTTEWQLWKRARLIRRLFPHGGKNAFFEPPIRTEYGYNVFFGENFYMNFDCMLLDVCPIKIGDNVMFGPRVIVATPCHPLLAEERIQQQWDDGFYDLEYGKPITIGSGVWVASGSIICGGVSIGEGSVIAAGSVVVRDIPPRVLAGGAPCKVIRPLTEKDRLSPEFGKRPGQGVFEKGFRETGNRK
jgi:maltose O-acetyltransferase